MQTTSELQEWIPNTCQSHEPERPTHVRLLTEWTQWLRGDKVACSDTMWVSVAIPKVSSPRNVHHPPHTWPNIHRAKSPVPAPRWVQVRAPGVGKALRRLLSSQSVGGQMLWWHWSLWTTAHSGLAPMNSHWGKALFSGPQISNQTPHNPLLSGRAARTCDSACPRRTQLPGGGSQGQGSLWDELRGQDRLIQKTSSGSSNDLF